MQHFHTTIIEDDVGVRALLYEVLMMRDHKITTIPSRSQLDHFIERNCHCNGQCPCAHFFLLDLYMPEFYTLTWWEAMHNEGCAVPEVGMLSASWTEAEKEKAKNLGCTVFDKPFDVFAFNDWIAERESSVQT